VLYDITQPRTYGARGIIRKKLAKLVTVVILLLALATVLVTLCIDAIAKTAIQSAATQASGVKTTVDSMSIGILAGQCELERLKIDNPRGFEFDEFFELGHGAIDVRLRSLLSDTVDIKTLMINDVNIYLEKQDGKANYQVILDNLKSSERDPQQKFEGKKFLIRSITVTNVNAHIKNFGLTLKKPIHIDRIKIANFGSESNKGLVIAELSGIVLKAVFAAVVQRTVDLLPDLAGDLAKSLAGLKNVPQINLEVIATTTKQVQKGIDNLVKTADDLGKSTDSISKGIGDTIDKGLGELLKPKDKK